MIRSILGALFVSSLLAASSFAAPAARAPAPVVEEEFHRQITLEVVGEHNELTSDYGSLSGTSAVAGLGIGAIWMKKPTFGIEGRFAMFQKKYDSFYSSTGATLTAGSLSFTTVRISGEARYYPNPIISLGVGLFSSVFLGDAQVKDLNGNSTSAKWESNRFDWGPVIGVRLEAPVIEALNLVVDFRYYFGLMSYDDEGSTSSTYSRDMELGIGVGLPF